LVLKLRNADQFQKCLDAITDPTSPYYGQFLNATTLEPYLPTPGQRVSIIQYLTRHSFNVTSGPSPLVLNVAGSVNVIQHVFGLKLGIYQKNTNSSFYAADSDPKMPQNLAAIVNGITGLDNYTTIRPADQSVCSGPYCPQGIQVGYSLSGLFASGYDGTGQKAAIVDAPGDPSIQTALNTYSTQYGLPQITLDIHYPDGVPLSYNPSWASETAMDVEAVHAVAPRAGIVLLYDTGDLMNAIDYVATNNLAKIVSNSWTYSCGFGSCSDTQLPSSTVSSTDNRLAVDAAQGLTILFASGDEGAKPDGSSLGTEFPASDPNVLAIGATNLVLAGCVTNTCTGYGSETGASISGGGYSGHFAEPSWQTSTIGVKSGSCAGGKCRAVPDVSMFGYSPSFWVYSTVSSGVCSTSSGQAGWFFCAGTSLSTPLWAGFLAVALQMRGGGSFGNIGPKLYGLWNSGAYSTAFHDITIGSNNGYSASTGWDPVTGWGSPIANVLAANLAQGKVAISLSPTSGGIGTPVSITGSNFLFTDTTCAASSVPSVLLSGQTCSITNGAVTASFTVASGVAAQSYTVSVTGSHGSDVASATFTVTSTQVTVTSNITGPGFVVVDSVAITTPTTYSWITGSTHSISANSPVSGSTGIQYVFSSWSDAGALTHTIKVPSGTATYTANYKTQFQLTIAGNPSGGGSTNPSVGSYWYDSNASPQISQTASVGYSFFYWSLDGTNVAATPTFTVLMNAPHTLTALFRGSSTISMTLSSNLGKGVTISGTLTPTQSSPGIPAGATIVLSYSLGGGYSPFITTTTASGGGYSVFWIPPYPGSYSLQASWGGDANYVGSASSVSGLIVSGTVTPQPQLLITGPASASRGTTASFTVLITNPTTSTISSTTLYVEIIGPNGYYYFDAQQATVSAGASGRFQFDWQVPSTISTGSYVVNVGLIPPTSSSISQTQITIT
jgi:kumamolisin